MEQTPDNIGCAFAAGADLGARWEGPYGDGSFCVLSLDFICEQADTYGEQAADFMNGFWTAYDARFQTGD